MSIEQSMWWERSLNPNFRNVEFITNPQLDKIVWHIKQKNPDWEQIAQGLKKHTMHRKIPIEHLPGEFAEYHLTHELDIHRDTHLERISPIKLQETKNFIFESTNGRPVAKEKATGKQVAEYDAITNIRGLLVVWEVKVLGSKGSDKIQRAVQDSRIKRIFKPLVELEKGNNQFGYVVVTTRNLENRQRWKALHDKGIQFVTMPVSIEEFRDKSYEMGEKYGLIDYKRLG